MNPPVSPESGCRYRVPAEWQARDGALLAWPAATTGPVEAALADTLRRLITMLREHEPVYLLVPPDEKARIARELGGEDDSLRLEPCLTNDIWMRDAGPLGARVEVPGGSGSGPVFLDGGFNGWGGKYPCEMDRLIPTVLARRWRIRRLRTPFRVEGGAVEVNGRGDLLTTESVLLNPNRGNPDRAELERLLCAWFGVRRVHWLRAGLTGDDTDGHIDNLARFVAPDKLVCVTTELPAGHPDRNVLHDNWNRLAAARGAAGAFELIALPLPEVTDRRGTRLPASYANFHIAPGLVLVPQFGQTTDDEALGVLRALFPGRRVRGLDARPVLAQGGTFHCLTQPLILHDPTDS